MGSNIQHWSLPTLCALMHPVWCCNPVQATLGARMTALSPRLNRQVPLSKLSRIALQSTTISPLHNELLPAGVCADQPDQPVPTKSCFSSNLPKLGSAAQHGGRCMWAATLNTGSGMAKARCNPLCIACMAVVQLYLDSIATCGHAVALMVWLSKVLAKGREFLEHP